MGRQKGIVFLPILIIILALSVIGYFVYRNFRLKKEYTQPLQETVIPTLTSTITPSSPTVDPMSGWKTFKSSSYLFRYPPDMELTTGEESRVTISKKGPTQKPETELFDGISLSFQPEEVSNVVVEEYVKDMIKTEKDVGIAENVGDPYSVSVGRYKGWAYETQGLGVFTTLVVGSNDGKMLIEITEITLDPGNLGFQATTNNILSTFEFVN